MPGKAAEEADSGVLSATTQTQPGAVWGAAAVKRFSTHGKTEPSVGTLTDPTSADSPENRQRQALVGLLRQPRYEVLPLAGTADIVEQHVPLTLPVTVTASPRKGLEPTITLAEGLARGGFTAIPHLAARLVYDEAHLSEILCRLDDSGVRDVFVVGGDGETPVGDFADSLQLLSAMKRLRQTDSGRSLQAVGVAGYPEGHPRVSQDELDRALLEKQPLSSYIVTQMCFDAGAVHGWIGHARALGVRLPVHAGIAGAVDRLKLMRIAGRIGVGTSLRFLRKQEGGARLLRSGGFRPDRLLDELTSGGELAMDGLHVYTLGDVETTERWRRELLDRLTDGGGHG